MQGYLVVISLQCVANGLVISTLCACAFVRGTAMFEKVSFHTASQSFFFSLSLSLPEGKGTQLASTDTGVGVHLVPLVLLDF